MNPIFNLWKKRIVYYSKIYKDFISLSLDAITIAYSILLIGALIYAYLPQVNDIIYAISTYPVLVALQFITVIVMIAGKRVGYLKMADEVFLTPLEEHGRHFISYSNKLSIGISMLGWSLYSLLLFIIFRNTLFDSVYSLLLLWSLGIIIKLLYINIKFWIFHKTNKSNRLSMDIVFKGLFGISSYIIISRWWNNGITAIEIAVLFIFAGLLLIYSYRVKNRVIIKWNQWIIEEVNNRAMNFAFFLGNNPKEKQNSRSKSSATYSGRKAEPFSPKGALLLLYYRTLIRGKGNPLLLFQMTIFMFVMNYSIYDGRVSLLVNLFFIFLISDFLVSVWNNFKESIWLTIYPITYEDGNWAIKYGPIIPMLIISIFVYAIQLLFYSVAIHPLADLLIIIAWGLLVTYAKASSQMLKMKDFHKFNN
ncbi:ABC transporter permease [Alkaliphilus peptidifermentans]|uniref:ABC-2 type transport system permease protein n=1 Tax=Alkaliphilus peptidifermentans DSM 18978 TaxID=1120976 RepID=A0A1G5ELB3_9FIRM|nr:ABC transporter permease [Alkaliphilus peptidifermentans]SCY27787.1 ABC-2 type transport system permease protein [Alkaliphilus peptidifermentans DSM 18978]